VPISKPWLLLQLRLSKLKEEKEMDRMGGDENTYVAIQDAHQDLMADRTSEKKAVKPNIWNQGRFGPSRDG